MTECELCNGTHWVCEDHPDHSFEHLVNGESCGGAGQPCGICGFKMPEFDRTIATTYPDNVKEWVH